MNSNIKLEDGKLIVGTEIVEIRNMEKDMIRLQAEKVGWVSLIGSIALLVALFNIFVIGQLNSFRSELTFFRSELTRFETSINNRFDKLEHRMDIFEQALIESNKRTDALFQELINLKSK